VHITYILGFSTIKTQVKYLLENDKRNHDYRSTQTRSCGASPTKTEQKDYQFILEENLELLRQAGKEKTQALADAKKIQELERALVQSRKETEEAKRVPWSYRKGRKIVLGLHVLLAVIAGFSGPALWYTHASPVEACWTALGGILWLVAATAYLDSLASDARV
jgi:hypothetical protein